MRHLNENLHRDESGTVSVLAVLEAAFLAALLVLCINTMNQAVGKAELQNAVDASTVSGATWVARGLNLVSLNNVTQTQLLALSVVILATDATIEKLLVIAQIQLNIARSLSAAPPPVGPIAAAYAIVLQGQMVVLNAKKVVVKNVVSLATPPNGLLWQAMKGLSWISAAIVSPVAFPQLAQAETVGIGQENGVWAFMVPAKSGPVPLLPRIPVRAVDFSYLCDPTEHGSPTASRRGYVPLLGYSKPGEGPLPRYGAYPRMVFGFYPNLFGAQVYDAAEALMFHRVCPNQLPEPSGSVTIDKPIDRWDSPECTTYDGLSRWNILEVTTREFETRRSFVHPVSPDEPWVESSTPSNWRDWRPPGCADPCCTNRSPEDWNEGDRTQSDGPGLTTRRPCHVTPQGRRFNPPAGACAATGGAPPAQAWVFESERTVQLENPRYDKNGPPDQAEPRYITKYYYVITYNYFAGGSVTKDEDLGDPPGQLAAREDLPKPYVLGATAAETNSEIKASLEYFGVAYREREVRAWPRFFRSPLGPHRLTYCQARVFNGTSFDLFTQDWRVRLVPATMLEDGRLYAAISGGLGPAGDAIDPLVEQAIDGLTRLGLDPTALLRFVNNH